ncbi:MULTISPECIES: DEAD/DEAH box helicase family protein [Vibrio]|uniref:DEAD/DEAH box helicase n=1 Tax=Vibrio TaxID=662 RepID=UPI0008417F74|nr:MULTISPECIES: DEAD/DEAH box helicase family protein [Vibrio]ODM56049.1 hypothetical protein BC455_22595 [Vibrio harveyi]USD58534.1 DEAD/DEAH box helicase family protein [Vibrio sp. SCSIO 43155]
MLVLRSYQIRVIKALWNWFRRNQIGHPLLKAPTGSGKTIILAQIITEALAFKSQHAIRIAIVTHNTTLVSQNYAKFKLYDKNCEIDAGLNCASLKRRDTSNQVIFAAIQSIYKRDDIGTFDLILVDECHYIPKKGDGMYKTFISNQQALNPKVRVVGLTATDYRLSSGKLTEGEGRLFTAIAAEIKLAELLSEGYLVPIRYVNTDTLMRDMQHVSSTNGDWNQVQAGQRMMEEGGTKAFLDDAIRIGKEYKLKKWKIYCTTLEHCEEVYQYLKNKKYSVEVYSSEVPDDEKVEILRRYSTNRLKVLISCEALITGFDETKIDLIINLKPTKSRGRWEQLCGRGMRPHNLGLADAKKECYLADYTPNTHYHGRADRLDLSIDGLYVYDSYIERCQTCGMAHNLYDTECEFCGLSYKKNRAAIYSLRTLVNSFPKKKFRDEIEVQCPTDVEVKVNRYNSNLVIQVVFRGHDAREDVNVKEHHILSEFLTFGREPSVDQKFFEFFTETEMPANVRSVYDFAAELSQHIKKPRTIFTVKNGKGYNTSVGFVREGKQLHWSKTNDDVLRKIMVQKELEVA